MGDTKIFMTAETLQSQDYIYSIANQITYGLAGFKASFAVKINHIGLTTKHNGGITVSDDKLWYFDTKNGKLIL